MDKCDAVVGEISRLSANDADVASRQFFSLLADIANSEKKLVRQIINEVLGARPLITEEHMAWLLFACAQYLTDHEFDCLRSHQEPHRTGEIRARLLSVFRENTGHIVMLCSTKNICTNLPNRYAGLQIIANLIFDGTPIHVLDIGCSLGLGLMALNSKHMGSIAVTDNLLKRALQPGLQFSLCGLDIFQPDLRWLCACYLPEYQEHRALAEQLCRDAAAKGETFEFVQGDALRLNETPALIPRSYDIVWTSNTCYQVEGEAKKVLEGIRSMLKPNGFWIYAYYRNRQPGVRRSAIPLESSISNPYAVCVYPVSEWNKYLEVLEADNDEVLCLRRGVDFDEFYADFTR